MPIPTIQETAGVLADPELRFTPQGKAVLSIRLAFNDSRYNEETRQAGKAYTGKTHPPPVLRSVSGLTARYKVFSVTVEREEASRHEKGPPQRTLRPGRAPRGKRVAL